MILGSFLQVQRSLKMKIEAQARFMDKITEEFKNRAASSKPIKPFSPVLSLPSLSEESDQSGVKQFDSDSEEVDTSEVMSKGDFRPRKRIKMQDDSILPQVNKLPSLNSDSQNLGLYSLDGMNNNLFTEQELGFPWNVVPFQPQLPVIYSPMNFYK